MNDMTAGGGNGRVVYDAVTEIAEVPFDVIDDLGSGFVRYEFADDTVVYIPFDQLPLTARRYRVTVTEEPGHGHGGTMTRYDWADEAWRKQTEDALNPWKIPPAATPRPASHRIVLARFDGGWADWRLECLHGPDDPEWHVYCEECADRDCGHRTHRNVCIVRPWWDEEGVELVADTTGPVTVPFDVDVEWWMDVPRLIHRITREGQ